MTDQKPQAPIPAPPAPEPGEVGELWAWMRSLEDASIWFETGSSEDRNRARVVTLLQQLSAPAPAVVPVADRIYPMNTLEVPND